MTLLGAVALLVAMPNSPFDQTANSNHFYPGYCTWAAADEAQRAWGVWLPWYGDAGDWAAAARDAGWHVSALPQSESIAAMPRGIQGSGPDGHVAWVLAVSSDGSTVTVRSMNWHGRGVTTVHELLVDGRIQFISPPGPGDGTPDAGSMQLAAY
jgi:surface antigen